MKPSDEDEIGLLKKDKPTQPQTDANPSTQNPPLQLPDKILMYIKATFWFCLGVGTMFYTNFFYHFFFSPKLYQPFHTICIAAYVIVILFLIFACFILPYGYGIDNLEEYNPKLIPTVTAFGFIGVITLLISVWPIWGYSTLLIFLLLWKGFFAMGQFLPKGIISDLAFALFVIGSMLSYKFIPHEGYFH